MVDVKPEARYAVKVDPRVSGDGFLDRFVVPYAYGGVVRFSSGRRYRFSVYRDTYRDDSAWGIQINQRPPRERW